MDALAKILIILGVSIVVIMTGLLALLIVVKKRMAKVEATNSGSKPALTSNTSSPAKLLDIVKERYARGEITREQYEQLKKDLS